MRFLFLIALFLPCAALAQVPFEDILSLTLEEKEEFLAVGLGARGRYTSEQAQLIAWQHMGYARPVAVVQTDFYRRDQRYYHVIDLEVRDGSIYGLTVNAITGQVQWMDVEVLGDRPRLPEGALDQVLARDIALAYVKEETRGVGRPRVQEVTLQLYEREIVYRVQIKKAQRYYEVFVAVLGEGGILDVNEL